MMNFLAMGGYAWYVWMAYGAVAVAIVVETIALKRRNRRALESARMMQQGGSAASGRAVASDSKKRGAMR